MAATARSALRGNQRGATHTAPGAVARILAREAVLGWMIWHAAAAEPPLRYALLALVLALLAAATLHIPLAPTRRRWGPLTEGMAVLLGAVSVANILSILVGAPPVLHL